MNQKDWIEYFEVINDRKPTPQEFAAAKEAGEFESDSLINRAWLSPLK